ncbi:MAG: Nre family DNA repair protein [Candidatus Bathyarchaeota archaeon]
MPKRITKRVKKPKNIWLREMLSGDPRIGEDLDYTSGYLRMQAPSGSLCTVCKGSKMLCGRSNCPVVARASSHFNLWRNIKGRNIDGSSPPSVFVGRFGYPYVNIGPLTPNYYGDTSILDAPEQWLGRSIEEIIGFRSQLVRGMYRVNVHKPERAGRILDMTRELSLAEHYVETDMKLKKRPRRSFRLDADVQPIGPTAPLDRMEIGYIKWDRDMEKAHYDTDLKAATATQMLYNEGIPVNQIMRAFSMGSFGVEKNRRLVPTRWSITAVDDILGKDMARQVKAFPFINHYEVYESKHLGNRFEVLLVPDAWAYEAYEAWYPGTVWNPLSSRVAIITDWEGYDGRSKYASMGGCYYSGRLAVLEHLIKVRRQARVFIIREAYPDYILPVGVWQVRENVRNAMQQPPLVYDTMEEALSRLRGRLSIPLESWMDAGFLLRQTLAQRKITDYF